MQISDEDLKEFMALYEREFGEQLARSKASEMATRLINLYMLLAKPLPSERATTQSASMSDPPHASHIAPAPDEASP